MSAASFPVVLIAVVFVQIVLYGTLICLIPYYPKDDGDTDKTPHKLALNASFDNNFYERILDEDSSFRVAFMSDYMKQLQKYATPDGSTFIELIDRAEKHAGVATKIACQFKAQAESMRVAEALPYHMERAFPIFFADQTTYGRMNAEEVWVDDMLVYRRDAHTVATATPTLCPSTTSPTRSPTRSPSRRYVPPAPSVPIGVPTMTPTPITILPTATSPTPPPSAAPTNTPSAYSEFVLYNRGNPMNGVINLGMPKSYWVNHSYFNSIYSFHGTPYNVINKPDSWEAVSERFEAISQIVLQTSSINLYDSATMLIALGLMDAANTVYSDEAYEYGLQWLRFLLWTDEFSPNYHQNSGSNNRAPTVTDYSFLYGNLLGIIAGPDGYMYREVMEYFYTEGLPNNWCIIMQDNTTKWKNYYYTECDDGNKWYEYGNGADIPVIRKARNQLAYVYDDYRPVTGEHVWGRILGPLLFDELTMSSAGLTVAMKAWEAVRAMMVALQNGDGTYLGHVMYYMPLPSSCAAEATPDTNPKSETDDELCLAGRTFSIENLASTIAAVRKMASVMPSTTVVYHIRNTTKAQGDASYVYLKQFLEEMDYNLTQGYLSVGVRESVQLKTNLINKEDEQNFTCSPCVVQGGLVKYPYNVSAGNLKTQDDPSKYEISEINRYFAVDVHTWGLSVLATDIRDFYNLTMPFELWRQVRRYGGYSYQRDTTGCSETVHGVGYTYPNSYNNDEVISGEWTLGALFAVRTLRQMYNENNCTSTQQDNWSFYEYALYGSTSTALCTKTFTDASKFCEFAVAQLVQDETNMLQTLDAKLETNIEDMSSNGMGFAHQVGRSAKALYYNNHVHYRIPFGWDGGAGVSQSKK
eukprot:gene220-396_t